MLLAVLMLAGLSAISVGAETYIVDDGYKFTRDSTSATICEYLENEPDVTLPSTLVGLPVTGVGEYAFKGNTVIKSMTMPISITKLERGVFFECTSLESVTLPKNCTQIGQYMFYGCTSLTNVSLPNILSDVPRFCFRGCSSLKTIDLPSTVKSIGDYAFANCPELESVYVSKYVSSISKTAFDNSPKAVIYGYMNSYAYEFAMENSIPFSAVDAAPDTLYVTFFDAEGSVFRSIPVFMGNSVVPPTDYPTKPSTDTHYYEFAYWEGNFTNVQKNEMVYPVFNEYEIEDENEPNTYSVVFLDGDGKFMEMQTVEKGGSATAPEDTPKKSSSGMYNFIFSHWDTDFTDVRENLVVRPLFTEEERHYTVKFTDMYGEVIDSQRVSYGEAATAPEPPEENGYEFIGWDADFSYITTHTTITALYEKIPDPAVYTVVFVDGDGYLMDVQNVIEGQAATAPFEIPQKASTERYVYTFTGWNADFSCVTENITVRALFAEKFRKYRVTFMDMDGRVIHEQPAYYGDCIFAPVPPRVEGYVFEGWDADFTYIKGDLTVNAVYSKVSAPAPVPFEGKLRIEVTGGTGFTIAVNEGNPRPQGTSYLNTKVPVGTEVTVVANDTDNIFLGWMNEAGTFVSVEKTYSFITSGNNYLKAVYMTDVQGVNSVIFKNDKAAGGKGQVLDMQYYSSSDEVLFPDAPSAAGYEFLGWNMDEDMIRGMLEAGQDVTVLAVWEAAKIYIDVIVFGGTVTSGTSYDGQYLAYNAMTVTADAAPEGEKFAYWMDMDGNVVSYDAQYRFFPATSTELTAVFVPEDEEIYREPLVFITSDPTTDGEKITYTMSWDIDESIGTVTSAGLMVVNLEDYNEDTFYHGTSDTKVFDRALGASAVMQKNSYSIAKSASYYDNTYIACTFVVYTDAVTGESVTVYSANTEVYKYAP